MRRQGASVCSSSRDLRSCCTTSKKLHTATIQRAVADVLRLRPSGPRYRPSAAARCDGITPAHNEAVEEIAMPPTESSHVHLIPPGDGIGRRRFLRTAGVLGLGAAAATLTAKAAIDESESSQASAQELQQSKDTVKEIFTAALIAEDLATTFYYNGLVGPVIQDVNLAGPGGSATNVTAAGNFGNVDYLRAALTEEIAH